MHSSGKILSVQKASIAVVGKIPDIRQYLLWELRPIKDGYSFFPSGNVLISRSRLSKRQTYFLLLSGSFIKSLAALRASNSRLEDFEAWARAWADGSWRARLGRTADAENEETGRFGATSRASDQFMNSGGGLVGEIVDSTGGQRSDEPLCARHYFGRLERKWRVPVIIEHGQGIGNYFNRNGIPT